jgi:hypothetical protein
MMFVAHDVLLDVTFGMARPRLVSLASSRALVDASRAAYQEGLVSHIRAGAAPGQAESERTTRLAQVRFLPPVERAHSTTIGLRWEASGLSAGLFPVLDADITLAVAGEQTTTLTLSGVYRTAAEAAALLGAPVPDAVAGGGGLAVSPAEAGLMGDIAVRALLRYAAGHLTGLTR